MSTLTDAAIERLRAAAAWPDLASGRYTVTGEIGHGGMGTVYSATDEALGREVAIKVSNALVSDARQRRLHDEARVLASLEHPGIVPVHDVGRLADGRVFYVMKRVHGRTLRDHLRDASALADRLRIFERICEAVSFAHARGILHRDLKPDNVMIGSFGEVMVMDWGVARAIGTDDDGEAVGTVVGTPGCMAPEQARGEAASLDERTDVYGLGVILLALLTGREQAVTPGTPAVELFGAEPSVPSPLRSICSRALSAEPAGRYPSAAALGADVARHRAGQAVEAHRETAVERAMRLATLYRVPILLVVAYILMRALVALVAGL